MGGWDFREEAAVHFGAFREELGGSRAEEAEEAEAGQRRRRFQGGTSVAELLNRRQFTLARFAKIPPAHLHPYHSLKTGKGAQVPGVVWL